MIIRVQCVIKDQHKTKLELYFVKIRF